MIQMIVPHLQVSSVFDLQAENVKSLGLSGLLLDLDNTLKDHDATDLSREIIHWAQSLQQNNLKLCLFSNARHKKTAWFAERLGVPFIARAYKPFPFRCAMALEKIGVQRSQAALVGDQVFADVLAGRLAGLFTILVQPSSIHEPWFTRIKRPFERIVLRQIASSRGRSTGEFSFAKDANNPPADGK